MISDSMVKLRGALKRSYWFVVKERLDEMTNDIIIRYMRGVHGRDDITKDDIEQVCRDPSSNDCVDHDEFLNVPSAKQTWIDATFTNDSMVPKVCLGTFVHSSHVSARILGQVQNGIKMGEGDGTVSLLSLGAMCAEGWKRPRWNPGGIKVVTVEVKVSASHDVAVFKWIGFVAPASSRFLHTAWRGQHKRPRGYSRIDEPERNHRESCHRCRT